jgi:hypothetical protein
MVKVAVIKEEQEAHHRACPPVVSDFQPYNSLI